MSVPEGARVRPMTDADVDLVLRWRNSDRVRERMLTTAVIAPDEHAAWWERASADPTREDLIFEVGGRPVGVSSLSGMSGAGGPAEWGFYIGADGTPSGSGYAMGEAVLAHAFEVLGLSSLVCRVRPDNERSLRMLTSLGFERAPSGAASLVFADASGLIVLSLSAVEWRAARGAR